MNLAEYLSGCWSVLAPQKLRQKLHKAADEAADEESWRARFNLSRAGLKQSYIAVLLSIPAYYICALAIATQRASLSGAEPALVAPAVFGLVALIYSLTFSASVYIITMVFDKQPQFRPWVIVRHWAVFFSVFLAACFYGLYLIGAVPIFIPNALALALYLGSLAIDIRLAQKLGEFDLTAAIFTGCIIFAMGLSVLLMSVVQIGVAI